MRDQIEAVLATIRPALQRDGGDLEFLSVTDGVVTLRAVGYCFLCPLSIGTLREGVESALRERIAEVSKVVLVKGAKR
jgi:Fe-S cluster biogenesis protein NfuA